MIRELAFTRVMAVDPATIAAWVGVITAAFALFLQGYNVIRGRKKEQVEMKEALDKAPLVRDQLKLGNISGAVETLNLIIQAQERYILAQDERHAREIKEVEESCHEEIQDLRSHIEIQEEQIRILRLRLQRYESPSH